VDVEKYSIPLGSLFVLTVGRDGQSDTDGGII